MRQELAVVAGLLWYSGSGAAPPRGAIGSGQTLGGFMVVWKRWCRCRLRGQLRAVRCPRGRTRDGRNAKNCY